MNALVAEVDRGTVAPTAKTVGALLDAWLEHIENLGRSPTTLYGYRRLVAQMPADLDTIGHVPWVAVEHEFDTNLAR